MPQQKKASQSNPFAHHQRSVTVSDGVSSKSKSVYTDCLSQVKFDVTTVGPNNSCSSLYSRSLASSSSFRRTVPRRTERRRQSALLHV